MIVMWIILSYIVSVAVAWFVIRSSIKIGDIRADLIDVISIFIPVLNLSYSIALLIFALVRSKIIDADTKKFFKL